MYSFSGKINKSLLRFITFIFILTGCQSEPDKLKGRTIFKISAKNQNLIYKFKAPFEIKVREVETNRKVDIADSISKPLKLSEIFDQERFRLVKLESVEGAFLREVSKIILNQLGIFILDAKVTKQIVWFNHNGGFIKNFSFSNIKMKSPEDFDVKDGILSIIDQESQLFTFKLFAGQAKQFKQFKLPFVASSIKIVDTATILCFNKSYDFQPFSFLTININDSSITGSAIPIRHESMTKFIERFPIKSASSNNEIICGVPNYDTIYKVKNGTISPFLVFNFGKYAIPANAYEKAEDFKKFGYKARSRRSDYSFETSKYFTASFSNYLINWVVFNKKNQTCIFYKSLGDDLSGGIFNKFPIAAYDDSLIQIGSSEILLKIASVLNKMKNKNSFQTELTKFAAATKERDNPLLLLYVPKDIK